MNMNMKNEDTTAHELSVAVSDFIDTLCNIADENNKNRDDLINTAGSLLCFLTHTTTFQNNNPKETLMEKHWKECMQIAHYDNELNGNRGWIPCKDRLPEAFVPVLVCSEHKTVYIADYNGEEWEYTDEGGMPYECEFKNTHWMPLPAPPVEKKEKEDENAD